MRARFGRATAETNGVRTMKRTEFHWIGSMLLLVLAVGNVPYIEQKASGSSDSSKAVRAFVTNFGGDGISVVDPQAGQLITNIKTGSQPHGIAIARDGRAVYVSNEGDGTVSVIDPTRNAVAATIE